MCSSSIVLHALHHFRKLVCHIVGLSNVLSDIVTVSGQPSRSALEEPRCQQQRLQLQRCIGKECDRLPVSRPDRMAPSSIAIVASAKLPIL